MEKELKLEEIKKYSKNYNKKKELKAKENAIRKNGISACSINQDEEKKFVNAFSINIDSGKITNQKRSGRCWMFAAMNVLRLQVMKNLNIENMELSQAYPLFFDKLEKSNYFLESILKTLDEKLDSQLVQHLLRDPLCDGGQWTMLVNLVKKYGVCPKEVYPESFSSSNTYALDTYLTLKLREYCSVLRKEYANGEPIEKLRDKKEEMLNEVYHILCLSLGEPPLKFDYEYVDKDKKYHKISNVTPTKFFEKYVKVNLDDYVSILNCPSETHPLNRTFTVNFLNNVEGGDPVLYLNLPIERVKELCIDQLKDGEVVWFGSDVGQFSTRESGILSIKVIEADKLLDTSFNMSKGERVDYGESLMTHAMVLTGVNLVDDKNADRWRVENSWGKDVGYDGYYSMDDEWFENFVYQAVINKKYLTKEELEKLKEKPIELNPWDPMGSLA